jgi:hypothetical protein
MYSLPFASASLDTHGRVGDSVGGEVWLGRVFVVAFEKRSDETRQFLAIIFGTITRH